MHDSTLEAGTKNDEESRENKIKYKLATTITKRTTMFTTQSLTRGHKSAQLRFQLVDSCLQRFTLATRFLFVHVMEIVCHFYLHERFIVCTCDGFFLRRVPPSAIRLIFEGILDGLCCERPTLPTLRVPIRLYRAVQPNKALLKQFVEHPAHIGVMKAQRAYDFSRFCVNRHCS